MIEKLIKLIPTKLLIKVWNHVPMPSKLKEWIIWRGNSRFLVAVLGLITNDKGQILLLKHTYRTKPWGIPSGWIEHEDPIEALKREVYEETSFEIKVETILKTEYVKRPNRINIIMKGKYLEGTFTACSEISDYQFCDLGDWPEGMAEDQIELIEELLVQCATDVKDKAIS